MVGIGLMEILVLAGMAVLLGGGVLAIVFLTNRTNRNDGSTHGDGFSGSGPASYGD